MRRRLMHVPQAVRHLAGRLNCELPTIAPQVVSRTSTHNYLYGAVTDMQFVPPQV